MLSPKTRWAVVAAGALAAAGLVLGISASASSAAWPTCLGEPATIVGTDGNDLISGTSDDDVIIGLAGDDQIRGNGGFDRICGGDGNDAVLQTDPDFLGFAFVSGGAGDDTMQAGGDALVVADYQESTAPVTVNLGAGTATGEGTDTLIRVDGVWGSPFDDSLTGSGHTDYLLGDAGNDTLSGLAGADLMEGDPGDDTMDGGTGGDVGWYGDSLTAVQVNLAKGTATGEGSDRLTSIENLIGSKRADVLSGNSGRNSIDGRGGNDRLYGAGGKDRLDGSGGKDRADGGPARDVCHAERRVHCP
jgi:Ca2+-binding RTX toxin-like protein